MATAPPQRYAGSSFAQQTIPIYVMRPTACDSRAPGALRTPPPAGFVPAAQRLLDALAGPPDQVATEPLAPTRLASSQSGGFPAGGDFPVSGGLPQLGGFGGTPATPPAAVPPDIPPLVDQPPVDQPPFVQPPAVSPPGGGQPPIVITPPDVGPPSIAPPTIGQPPTGPLSPASAAVPEPATWSLMLLGVFALGGVLRSRRALAARKKKIETAL